MTSNLLFLPATSSKNRFYTIMLYLSIVSTGQPTAQAASQSSLEERTSFNSEEQITFYLGGAWGFDDKAFGNASFTHARTPLGKVIGEIDTYYQGTLGLGYAIDNVGFDVGVMLSESPLTKTSSIGGYLGFTYIFTSEFSDPAEQKDLALDILHTQIYEKRPSHPPLFWARFGVMANSMRSDIVGGAADSGKQTAFTIDLFYPWTERFLLSLGAQFFGYDDQKGFFSRSARNADNMHVALLGATLQGLPRSGYSLQTSYDLTNRDSATPRYQATELDGPRTWSHTIDLSWRHQFSKHWYMTPTYEATIQGDRIFTGFLFSLLYLF